MFAPEALVYHAVEQLGPLGMLRVAARWTETMRIFSRHVLEAIYGVDTSQMQKGAQGAAGQLPQSK